MPEDIRRVLIESAITTGMKVLHRWMWLKCMGGCGPSAKVMLEATAHLGMPATLVWNKMPALARNAR